MFESVGPVLATGEVATAIVAALRAANPALEVLDRGAYLRVSAPGRCAVTRVAIEASLGRVFELPRDLEGVMLSFSGAIFIDADRVEWTA